MVTFSWGSTVVSATGWYAFVGQDHGASDSADLSSQVFKDQITVLNSKVGTIG